MTHYMTDGKRLCARPDGHHGSHRSLEVHTRRNEYRRKQRNERYQNDPEYRESILASTSKRHQKNRDSCAFLYAIFFPESKVLKIGAMSGNAKNGALLAAQKRLRAAGFAEGDGFELWREPVSPSIRFLQEHRLQAEISYVLGPVGNYRSMSEYFSTEHFSAEDIIVVLKHALHYIEERNQVNGVIDADLRNPDTHNPSPSCQAVQSAIGAGPTGAARIYRPYHA